MSEGRYELRKEPNPLEFATSSLTANILFFSDISNINISLF